MPFAFDVFVLENHLRLVLNGTGRENPQKIPPTAKSAVRFCLSAFGVAALALQETGHIF